MANVDACGGVYDVYDVGDENPDHGELNDAYDVNDRGDGDDVYVFGVFFRAVYVIGVFLFLCGVRVPHSNQSIPYCGHSFLRCYHS